MSKILLRKFGHTGRLLLALALTMSILAGFGLTGQGRVRAQGDEVVSIVPADQEVSRGETFTVDVAIAEAENLWGYEFNLDFDPDVLQVESVADGSFLGSTGREVLPITPVVDNTAGTIFFSAVSVGDQDGPDGDGVLATVTFKAIGAGPSALNLRNVSVFSGTEERVPTSEDGSVTSLFAMAIDPPESLVNPGTFTVDVMLHGALDLTGYEFNLKFDPDVLQVASVEDGSFLGSTGRQVLPITPVVDNTAGTVFFSAVSVGDPAGPDGSGVLATITFDTADFGDSVLDLHGLEVSSGLTSETPDDIDGLVRVLRGGLSVMPEATSVSRCDTFEVELVLAGEEVVDVTGFDINLAWNADTFEVLDIAFAPFMESTERDAQEASKDIDNTAGTLNYAVVTVGTEDGPDAPGVIAVVELRAIGVGISDLELFDVEISFDGFDIEPAALFDGTAQAWPEADGFEFSTIDSPQVAGVPFMVTITAVDADENPVQHFSGEVTLSDTTGTLSPTMVEFVDGEPAVTAEMMITQAHEDIVITAQGTNPCEEDIAGESNAFDVEPDVENPAGVTIDPTEVTLTAGDCVTFTLTGVDAYGNTFPATDDAIFTVDGGGEIDANEFCAETMGEWTVTGTYLDVFDEATVTVEPDFDNPEAVTIAPAEETVTAGDSVTYTLMAEDIFGNAWDVTEDAAFAIDDEAGGAFDEDEQNVYHAQFVGEWTVTGSWEGLEDTATLTVVADFDNPVAVTIDPEAVTLEIGECVTFTLMAEDAYGNEFDVTDDDDTTFTVDDVELDANEFCAETAGVFTVTGTYLTVSAEATVTVEEDVFYIFLPIVVNNYSP